MPTSDVFNSEAFSLVSLTDSINKLPFKAGRIGAMNLFETQGVPTTTVVVEEINGILSLIPSAPRGAPGTLAPTSRRKARSLAIPHIPFEDIVRAEDVQNVRKFGTEDQVATAADIVNAKLERMRQSHELTLEWLRAGALKGIVVDGDGSTTLYNLFTEFNMAAPAVVDFLLGTTTTALGDILIGVKEQIEDALGDAQYDHIHAFCGSQFFRKFIEHTDVKYAYQYYQNGAMLLNDPRAGFEYKGVILEVYRGKVAGVPFVASGDARFFPVGVPGLFRTYFAPGDFMETANTLGLEVYAKQEALPFNRGIRLHTQSNPLPICTRPGVLIRGYSSN